MDGSPLLALDVEIVGVSANDGLSRSVWTICSIRTKFFVGTKLPAEFHRIVVRPALPSNGFVQPYWVKILSKLDFLKQVVWVETAQNMLFHLRFFVVQVPAIRF